MKTRTSQKHAPFPAEQVVQGLRVRSVGPYARGRTAMLTGSIDSSYRHPRLELIPEESAITGVDSWDMRHVVPLPLEEQLLRFGGSFQPPRGYPLVTVAKN